MRREIFAALLVVGCSGKVHSVVTNGGGSGGISSGGTGGVRITTGRPSFGGATSGGGMGVVCQDLTGAACQCPNGSPGIQICQNGAWGPCTCGSAPGCTNLTTQTCQCPDGASGIQVCENSAWGLCKCAPVMPGAGGNPNYSICGDGIVSGSEQCDGQNQNRQTCATVSMGACTGGYLICTAQCLFDYSACICGAPGAGGVPSTKPVCGDGIVSGNEQCDGQNYNNQDCATVSMGACLRGYLVCTPYCTFDYSACDCSYIADGGL